MCAVHPQVHVGGKGRAIVYTVRRELSLTQSPLRRGLKGVRIELHECLGKEHTRQRDQEVLSLCRWNVLDVVGEPKTSVAEETGQWGE